MRTRRLGEILDELFELHWSLGAITCGVYTDEVAKAHCQGLIDYTWDALEAYYSPDQMVKVRAMFDQLAESRLN